MLAHTLMLLTLGIGQAPTGTLTVDQALQIMRVNLPAMQLAQATIAQYRAQHEEAVAGWFPTASVSLGYKRTTANIQPSAGLTTAQTLALAPSASLNTYNSFTNTAAVTQLLWDFGVTENKMTAADEAEQSVVETERTTLIQSELALRSAFYTAAADKDLVTVADENLKNNDAHLSQTYAFADAGTGAEIDVATSDANVANALVQLITAKNNYATAKAKLNQAMGVEGSTDYDVAAPANTPLPGEDAPLQKLVDEGLANRPEEASLQAQLRSAQSQIDVAFDSAFPTIFATAGGSYSGATVPSEAVTQGGMTVNYPGGTVLNPNVYIGLGLSWTINIGPLAPATIRQYEAQRDEVQAQLDALHLQVRVDVESALLAVKAAIDSLNATHRALISAKKQLELATARYSNGVGSQIELGDAQVAADQAGASDVSALYTLYTARAQLLEALGRKD